MTNRDLFDRVKLQLSRLNNMWSPTGSTFDGRAEYYMRQATWDDKGDDHIILLALANSTLRDAYMRWNDAARDEAMDSWNAVYAALQPMVDDLTDTLSNKNLKRVKNF